jgi:integrase
LEQWQEAHTAAMLRLVEGESVSDISFYLGHSNVATTQNYLHQLRGTLDKDGERIAGLIGV